MNACKTYTLLFLLLIIFNAKHGKAQENQQNVETDVKEFALPSYDNFVRNKIPTTNAVNPEPAIFSMVNMTASQLATASISLDEQSLLLSPLHLNSKRLKAFDLALKAGLKDDITYLGAGIKWQAGNKRLKHIYDKNAQKYQALYEKITNINNAPVRDAEMEKFSNIYRSAFIEDIYSTFNRSHLTLHASATALVFEVIGGDDIDANDDGLIDNFHHYRGFNLSGGANFSFSQKLGIHLNYNYSERRALPVENAVSVTYNGFSATISRLFIINKNYTDSDEYLKHSFIPGLEIAMAFEYEDAIENERFAEDGIISQTALTPIIDLKISPLSQFRVALPVKMIELADNSKAHRFTAILQYNLQISEF